MIANTTHECPAPGCTRMVSFERFACVAHWHQIGHGLRAGLSSTWARSPGSDEYFAARAECLRALGVPADEIPALNAGVAPPSLPPTV
jgi:hypothetical protein